MTNFVQVTKEEIEKEADEIMEKLHDPIIVTYREHVVDYLTLILLGEQKSITEPLGILKGAFYGVDYGIEHHVDRRRTSKIRRHARKRKMQMRAQTCVPFTVYSRKIHRLSGAKL